MVVLKLQMWIVQHNESGKKATSNATTINYNIINYPEILCSSLVVYLSILTLKFHFVITVCHALAEFSSTFIQLVPITVFHLVL